MRCGLQSPPQSRPYPRGGSTLSSSARSSPHIASSRCASADSWRLSGKWSSPLILTLEVEQGAYRILPALRSGPAVLRPAVLHPGLRCLAALSIAPLSFRVTYRHCSTSRYAPLRNRFGLSVHRCRFAPSSLTAPPAGSPVAPVSGGDDASLARPTFPHQAVSGRGARCCGSNCVRSRSIAHATASNRSATVRSARPWRCPRARSAAYRSRLTGSCWTATRAQ